MDLQPYIDAGWDLIPLHSWNACDKKGRKRGKSPLHKDWTRRTYRLSDILAAFKARRNIGVRPRAGQLVIDVDPRRFGDGETLETDNPLRRLAAVSGLDIDACPTVITGSGGLHLYLRKSAEPRLLDSLEDYPGIEFKSIGRQVVSAGSRHPDGNFYQWDWICPELRHAPQIPEKLLKMIKRPTAAVQETAGGEYSAEQLGEMLDTLDVLEFSEDEQRWRNLMMACHYATGGEGREEFIDWSTGDPKYQDDRNIIGRRWDSLHMGREGSSITTQTLLKELAGSDKGIWTGAADDFDDDIIVGEESPPKSPLERLNEKFTAVMDGGKHVIMWEEYDPELERTYWVRSRTSDFLGFHKGQKISKGDRLVELHEEWLQWGGRKKAAGVVFDPEKTWPNLLNLWTGWGVKAIEGGSWECLRDLLHDNLCAGDEAVYEYVLNWAAHMVQHPGRPAEVALCFQGLKGTGKSTFGDALARICGRHGMSITAPGLLTGRFNLHLRDLVFLFADEAVTPYDKPAENQLKGFITQPFLTYEGKGTNAAQGKNRLHLVMATNDEWIVPAGLEDERRYMVQRVEPGRLGDHAFFARLHAELDNGGYEALLAELMARDITGWEPRDNVPNTEALAEQKLISMNPVLRWWFQILEDGELPDGVTESEEDNWRLQTVRVSKIGMRSDYESFCYGLKVNAGSGARSVGRKLVREFEKVIPNFRNEAQFSTGNREKAYEFPNLKICRKHFEKIIGTPIKWGH